MICPKRSNKLVQTCTGFRTSRPPIIFREWESMKNHKVSKKVAFTEQFGWGNLVDWERECIWSLDEVMWWKWEKQVRAQSKEILRELKKQHTFLHYHLHDSTQFPSHSIQRPLQADADLFFRSYFPALSRVFSVLPSLRAVSQQHDTLSCISAPDHVSSSAPTSSTWWTLPRGLTLSNAALFLWNFANSPLPNLRSPHPTSRSNCFLLELCCFLFIMLTFARGQKASFSCWYTKHIVTIQYIFIGMCSFCASRLVSIPQLFYDTPLSLPLIINIDDN